MAAAPSAEAASQRSEECGQSVKVAPGDTLSSLARRCGTTVSDLLRENPSIRNPNLVEVGTRLALPNSGDDEATTKTASKTGDGIVASLTETDRGHRVAIEVSDLPPRMRVWIKGGKSRSPKHHLILRGARVNGSGELRTTFRLPEWAEKGSVYLSLSIPRTGKTLVSAPLEVSPRRSAKKAK
ncbi:LysM peptidoglycan-binding domain-containing protein [Microvirga lenta]|uniref:LysM peptidoglycan-binding domain-containing protein n=1 Tax=Microvirga lenta TaxID=2881337 RepID=UPI001D000E6D|nr:LysM domain-containing protein [Microvirga lenta]MCB5175851.1 LysM peptidoglycan-binding domain-containing protein [Microvirga lenta]